MAKTCSKSGTNTQSTVLGSGSEETGPVLLFPEIETSRVPEVTNVVEVLQHTSIVSTIRRVDQQRAPTHKFDDGPEGSTDVGSVLMPVEQVVPELDDGGSSKTWAISLRATA